MKHTILTAAIIFGIFLLVVCSVGAVSQYNFTSGSYNITVFNGTPGTISWTAPNATVQVLIVGGGGSGGSGVTGNNNGGGGGGGGVLEGVLTGLSGSYTITVGEGGSAAVGNSQPGDLGGNSSISNGTVTWRALFGGAGGAANLNGAGSIGGNGGSGGGGGAAYGGYAPGNPGLSIQQSVSPLTGHGFNGSSGSGAYGGGGGGAGSAGTASAPSLNGTGYYSDITGVNTLYAWGGDGYTSDSTGVNGKGSGGMGKDVNSDAGGIGVVIIKSISTPAAPPVASFDKSTSGGETPVSVTFTDTSTESPYAWNWSYRNVTGNNTETWWTTTQNPTITFGIGNWSIKLTATNLGGSNTTPGMSFVNVSDTLPTYTIVPLPVANPPFVTWTISDVVSIARGGAGSFDQVQLVDADVLKWSDGSYRLYYSGYGSTYKIGMANSSTPGNWTKQGVVIEPVAGETAGVSISKIIRLPNGTYRMYFKSLYTTSPYGSVTFAQSTDGITWTRHGSPVISCDSDKFYNVRIDPEAIYFDNDASPKYTMLFGAYHDSVFMGGQATSNDGVSWTIHDDPVIMPGSSGQWDDNAAYPSAIYKIGSTFYLIYAGIDEAVDVGGLSEGHWKLGYATSTDGGITWTKYAGNPVMTTTPGFSRWSTENPTDPIITPDAIHWLSLMCAGAYHLATYDLVDVMSDVYPTPQNGYIMPITNQTVSLGTSMTFSIIPASGYNITDVLVDGVSVGAVSSYTFSSIGDDHTIYATFGEGEPEPTPTPTTEPTTTVPTTVPTSVPTTAPTSAIPSTCDSPPTTGAVTGLTSSGVTFNAGDANGTIGWFVWGGNSGFYKWRTQNQTITADAFTDYQFGSPMLTGHDYYVRACNEDCCGNEISFHVPSANMPNQSSYGTGFLNIMHSGFNATVILGEIGRPYTTTMPGGAPVTWGLLFFFIIAGYWLRHKDITIPCFLAMISGGAVWLGAGALGVPPEFALIGQGLMYAAIAGMAVSWFSK